MEVAFGHVGLDWQEHVVVDPELYRPAEIFELRGDSGRARSRLGWEPTVGFAGLVRMMVESDLAELSAAVSRCPM